MRDTSVDAPPVIDWGVATLARAGETESGDLHLVKRVGRGTLVAAVDGLGHGAEAAAAARAAVAALDRYAEESLPPLVRRCHEALAGSRGVVMSLAYVGGVQPSLTWLGVGNVEGVVLYAARNARRARTSLVTRGGIVGGAALPELRTDEVPVAPGDLLIFATDGIRPHNNSPTRSSPGMARARMMRWCWSRATRGAGQAGHEQSGAERVSR